MKTAKTQSTRAKTKSPRKSAGKKTALVVDNLEQINLHAAGIDVGSAENFVCVPPACVQRDQPNVRSFGVFSTPQDELVEWLKECGVTSVAMEATGIYWMSFYDKDRGGRTGGVAGGSARRAACARP